MKVASVYAMGSLSPALQKHVRQQQQAYNKIRDLSLGNASNNHNHHQLYKNSNVGISLSNVKLPQLANKFNGMVADHHHQQQFEDGTCFQPYQNHSDQMLVGPQVVASQQVMVRKNHAQISRNYIKEQLTNPALIGGGGSSDTPYQQQSSDTAKKKVFLVGGGSLDRAKKSGGKN